MADAAVPKSPALAAQQRKRGPTVLERMASEEAAARASKPPPQPRLALRPDGDADACSEVQRGASMKTGMVLSRARLGTAASGVVAAQERQASLLSKGVYRSAEKVVAQNRIRSGTNLCLSG